MTVAISALKNTFPLHTKSHDYHLKYPMCYSKCHYVDIFSLKKIIYVDEWNHIGNSRA